MSEIPSVKVLEAIKPINSGTGEEVLAYNGLVKAVDKYKPTNSLRSDRFWDSEEGSLEELSNAKQLASEYFLKTAEKVVNSHDGNRDLWADRFTQASTELYGEPENAEAKRLINDEYKFLSQLKDKDNISQKHLNLLLSSYKPMLYDNSEYIADEYEIKKEKEAIREYGKVILSKYEPLFALIDNSEKSEFSPKDLHNLFNSALEWLKDNDDKDWGEWTAIDTDGTSLSVNASERQIKIATRRECATKQEARGLIAHELLVHALRGKNGYKTGNRKLATGLAGYLDAEEGLGILVEEAVNGELPEKAYDRYLDIALALGSVDGVQRTRRQVFEISFARHLIREQLKGTLEEADVPSLERKVWGHIDRIYRGGRGDSRGNRQAIFTKDIAYYVGYKHMAKYITKKINEGKSAVDIFEYLSQAKFDPINPKHIEVLKNN
jgi:hypothetical protein